MDGDVLYGWAMRSFDGEKKVAKQGMLEPSPSRGLPLASSLRLNVRALHSSATSGPCFVKVRHVTLSRGICKATRSWRSPLQLAVGQVQHQPWMSCNAEAARRVAWSSRSRVGKCFSADGAWGASQQLDAQHELTASRPAPYAARLATPYLTYRPAQNRLCIQTHTHHCASSHRCL
jgi:hypothetical protein